MGVSKVALRRRPITGARESLYLDFYPAVRDPHSMKMIQRDYLGIYIYAKPKNEIEKEYNNEMLMKAKSSVA